MKAFLVPLASWAFAMSFVNRALAEDCTAPTEYGRQVTLQISTAADVAQYLAPCETFFGSLEIFVEPLNLDHLKNVTGRLQIGYSFKSTSNANSTSLSLGMLQYVGEDFNIYSATIAKLDLSNLTSVGGSLSLSSVGSYALLHTLSLPRLLSVGNDITVFGFSEMAVIDMPLLTSAGELNLQSLPDLAKLSCNADLYLTNPYLSGGINKASALYISGTSLTSLENIFISNFTTVSITNNPTLNSITLSGAESNTSLDNSNEPYTIYPTVTITNNGPNLAVAFPLLTAYLGYMTIGNTTSLNLSSLVSVSNELVILGNTSTFSAPNLLNIKELTLRDVHFVNVGCGFGDSSNGLCGSSKISLPSVQVITALWIHVSTPWSVSSLSMPKIKSIEDFDFDSNDAKFCQYWAHQRCLGLITHYFTCGSSSVTIPVLHSTAQCDNMYPATGLTYPKRLAVGLSLGVGVPLLALFLWWVRKVYKAPPLQVTVRRPPILLVDLPDENHEQLPKYQLHEATGELPGYGDCASNEVGANNGNSAATGSVVVTDGVAGPNQESSEISVR